jgi:hypothetical protein
MSGRWNSRVLLAAIVGCAGCSRPVEEARYDSDGARAALIAALDAWQKGDTKSLSKRNPPIRFKDDDLLAGLRLAEYEIEEPERPLKMHQDVEVILELRDAKGRRVHREARYQVATEPGLSVLRSDH